jgi:hypothetical protein
MEAYKMITDDIIKSLPPLYSTEAIAGMDKTAVLKFFFPAGRATYYVVEGERQDGDVLFFGYVVSPLGPDCDEWGYFTLNQLKEVVGPMGLRIERDIHFLPTKMSELIKD